MTKVVESVKFNKHHVRDMSTNVKARVHYSLDNRIDGRNCVTIYAKDYDRSLGKVIPSSYKNETDSMTDYFDQGKVVIFEDNPLYNVAREAVNKHFPKSH